MVNATGEPEREVTSAPTGRLDTPEPVEASDGSATNGSATNARARADEVRAVVASAKDKVVAGAADVRRLATDAAHSAQVVTAAEKTREAAGKAATTVKEKVTASPAVSAAAEKTLAAKDAAVGTVKTKAGEHPQVTAAAERAAATSGKAARGVTQQAKRHPSAARRIAVGSAVLLLVRSLRRRLRRRSRAN